MAYQAKRKKVYQEDFELVDEEGRVVHSLHVSIDPDSSVKNLSVKYLDLVHALDALNGADPDHAPAEALEIVGRTVTDILQAVFGEDDARLILDFYENRYIEMCQEVMPFVTGTVIPQVRKMAQDNRATIAAGYNRKARRKLFGKK